MASHLPSTTPLKLAIIGAGLIDPRHAQTALKDPDVTLVALVDPSPAAAQLATTLGTRHYPSPAALLRHVVLPDSPLHDDSDKPDAALVCTPNSTHVAVPRELLSAGIHVLCEKPLAVDVASGQSLVDHAVARQVRLLTAHHRLFNSYVVAARRILTSTTAAAAPPGGPVGRVTAVSGLWALYKPPAYFDPPTEWHRSGEAAGLVLINLIHDIDALHYLLDSHIVRVAAFAAPKRRTAYDATEGGAILLHFANGVVATFVLSDAVVSPHAFEMGTGENPMIPHTGRDVYRIFGTEGTLSVPDLKRSFYAEGVEKSWGSEVTEVTEKVEDWLLEGEMGKMPFELQMAHLVKVLRGKEEPVCTGEDGLAAVRVALVVKKALQTGEMVDVMYEELVCDLVQKSLSIFMTIFRKCV